MKYIYLSIYLSIYLYLSIYIYLSISIYLYLSIYIYLYLAHIWHMVSQSQSHGTWGLKVVRRCSSALPNVSSPPDETRSFSIFRRNSWAFSGYSVTTCILLEMARLANWLRPFCFKVTITGSNTSGDAALPSLRHLCHWCRPHMSPESPVIYRLRLPWIAEPAFPRRLVRHLKCGTSAVRIHQSTSTIRQFELLGNKSIRPLKHLQQLWLGLWMPFRLGHSWLALRLLASECPTNDFLRKMRSGKKQAQRFVNTEESGRILNLCFLVSAWWNSDSHCLHKFILHWN